jgi:hypothetical protein
MMFFSSVCIPLSILAVYSARRLIRGDGNGFTAELRVLFRQSFLPGLAAGVPVLILLLLLQRLVPFSYKPWRIYLYYFSRDQFIPLLLLLLLAAWLRRERSFLDLAFFLAGAFTLLNLGQLPGGGGAGAARPDLYGLCLLAFVRMGMLIYIPILFRRFLEEDGFLKVLFLFLLLLAAGAGGMVAYLYARFYLWLALVAGVVLPASSGMLLFRRQKI